MSYDPKYNILIVDDEDEVASIIQRYLSIFPRFKNIVIANDGVQALQKLQNQEFDLIITDLILPKRDGMTLIEDITKIPQFSKKKNNGCFKFFKQRFSNTCTKKRC
jgi:CheY-like chemotaxis protein